MKNTNPLLLQKKIKHLKNQIISMELVIKKFEKNIKSTSDFNSKVDNKQIIYSENIHNWFIKNCIQNQECPKNHRKYSKKMYNFCYSLYVTSPKAYKLLKQVIPLPSKSTLYLKFSNSIKEIKSLIDFLSNDSSLLIKSIPLNTVAGSGIAARNIASSNFEKY